MRIKINNEDELYNPLDEFEETLSENIISYINKINTILLIMKICR